MVVRVATVAFEGIEARPVDVQVQISNGNVFFGIVGLGDKAVAEFKDRYSPPALPRRSGAIAMSVFPPI